MFVCFSLQQPVQIMGALLANTTYRIDVRCLA